MKTTARDPLVLGRVSDRKGEGRGLSPADEGESIILHLTISILWIVLFCEPRLAVSQFKGWILGKTESLAARTQLLTAKESGLLCQAHKPLNWATARVFRLCSSSLLHALIIPIVKRFLLRNKITYSLTVQNKLFFWTYQKTLLLIFHWKSFWSTH